MFAYARACERGTYPRKANRIYRLLTVGIHTRFREVGNLRDVMESRCEPAGRESRVLKDDGMALAGGVL